MVELHGTTHMARMVPAAESDLVTGEARARMVGLKYALDMPLISAGRLAAQYYAAVTLATRKLKVADFATTADWAKLQERAEDAKSAKTKGRAVPQAKGGASGVGALLASAQPQTQPVPPLGDDEGDNVDLGMPLEATP